MVYRPSSFQNSGMAEIEINFRSRTKHSQMQKITHHHDAVKILRTIWSDRIEYVEECYMLCLNRAGNVLGWVKLSSGNQNSTLVDPKMIMQVALNANAASYIIAHNHPSGNNQPSTADCKLTKELEKLGKMMNLPIVDHLIVTVDSFYSILHKIDGNQEPQEGSEA